MAAPSSEEAVSRSGLHVEVGVAHRRTRYFSSIAAYSCHEVSPQSPATTRCPLDRRPDVPGPSSSTMPTPSEPAKKVCNFQHAVFD